MDGGDGNDTYRFANSFGADSIPADASGVDTLNFSRITTALSTDKLNGMVYDLSDPVSACEPSATHCLALGGTFIENAVGTGFNDQLTGNASRNKLTGGNGDDWLDGGDGPDLLVGNNGTDRLNGGAGNDRLNGSPETENDPAYWDYYHFSPNWGQDTITDSRDRGVIAPALDGSAAVMPPLTVNLVSDPSRPEVTDGNGNTMNWESNDVKGANTGAGDDVISQSPMHNSMGGGAGNDTYTGYAALSPQGGFGADSINDFAGTADVLDLSVRNLAQAVWRTFKLTSTSNVQTLQISINMGGPCAEEGCRIIYLSRYFDNTSPDVCASGPGPGLIETIKFANGQSVDFEQAKNLVISIDRIDNDGDGFTDETGETCPAPA